MSFDRADYVKVRDAGKKERERQKIPSLDLLTQAAVKAEHVTGHDAWDTFLSYLQSAVEKSGAHLKQVDDLILNPEVVNHDVLMQMKTDRARVAARIEAWEAAIALPRQIMEAGEAAENALLKLVESQDDRAA